MDAPLILEQLKAAGVRVSRRGDNLLAEPKAAVTDALLTLMREHKGELLAALGAPYAASAPTIHDVDPEALDPKAESRRQRVLAMLAQAPDAQYAVLTVDDGNGLVIVAIAIRGVASCELRIPRSKWDPFLFLEAVERYGSKPH